MSGYCLAHGLITLHWAAEEGRRTLPAVLFEHSLGAEALERAGPRVRRVARWDAEGWATWWEVVARLAGGRPVLAALPALEGAPEVPASLPAAYLVPPAVAVWAAGRASRGVALYLGAFAWEVAAFGPEETAGPHSFPPGLEPLYRRAIAEAFHQERRVLLPAQVPALLAEGRPVEVAPLLEGLACRLDRPALLGGEDEVATAAVASALRRQGYEVTVVDPLRGLERLLEAGGGLG